MERGQQRTLAGVGECALLTAFHQPASGNVMAPAVVTTACATHVRHIAPVALSASAAEVYRLAPKTSPPAAA